MKERKTVFEKQFSPMKDIYIEEYFSCLLSRHKRFKPCAHYCNIGDQRYSPVLF